MKLDEITNQAPTVNGVNLNDEFYTPRYAITPLLKYLTPNSNVWCPFDTVESNYVKMLDEANHIVYPTHIFNNQNFFKINPDPQRINYIISNPPYSLKKEVFQRLFQLNIPFAMLVGVVGLFESAERFKMFRDNEFEIMYFDKRVSFFKDYNDQKPSLNPPFSSVYITKGVLPKTIVFETIIKQ
jgi:hypothetical protein